MKMSNKIYDILKWIALTLLPALSVLYVAIAKILGLPFAAEVAGIVAAVDTFLGAILGISTKNYNKELKNGGE